MTKVNIKDDMKSKINPAAASRFVNGSPIDVNGVAPIQSSVNKVSYNKDTHADGSIFEYYEGNVEDVIKLLKERRDPQPIFQTMKIDGEELASLIDKAIDGNNLIYNQDEAANFIQSRFKEEGKTEVTKEVISKMIEYEEDYMRSVGIIED